MERYRKKTLLTVAVLFLCLLTACSARAGIVEAEPDLQAVMGDLSALSVAARLYYDDTLQTQCPAIDRLAGYLKKPLPADWLENCRIAEFEGAWWIGRRVPEFSRARKFLRSNASLLGLREGRGGELWLGGSFVWTEALSPKNVSAGRGLSREDSSFIQVAKGGGNAREHLFFNTPGTDYYWWSDLLFTPQARAAALEKFGAKTEGPFLIPPVPARASETLMASPVSPPPEFNLRDGEEGEEEESSLSLGKTGIQINPIPRSRN
ncbi:MAG: hypothetical protein LBR71_00540 [Synergistaceae bacterium]|jgi:hypothetical protein|nr:hypothetical protein [Synergistaceae bacterium]